MDQAIQGMAEAREHHSYGFNRRGEDCRRQNSKEIAHMHFEYKRRTVDEVTLYFRDGYKDVKL